MSREEKIREIANALNKELADKGKIIEGGWKAYEVLTLEGTSDIQKSECRKAFFYGAAHLFSSIMNFLEPGLEETEMDLERMDKLHAEISKFMEEMKGV